MPITPINIQPINIGAALNAFNTARTQGQDRQYKQQQMDIARSELTMKQDALRVEAQKQAQIGQLLSGLAPGAGGQTGDSMGQQLVRMGPALAAVDPKVGLSLLKSGSSILSSEANQKLAEKRYALAEKSSAEQSAYRADAAERDQIRLQLAWQNHRQGLDTQAQKKLTADATGVIGALNYYETLGSADERAAALPAVVGLLQRSGNQFAMGIDAATLAQNLQDPGYLAQVRVNALAAGAEDKVATAKAKKPQEAKEYQVKAADIARRMIAQNEVLGRLKAPSVGDKRALDSAWIPNWFVGDKTKEFDAAGRDFVSAKLRFESGGAITPDEVTEKTKVYLPVQGDSPTVIRQKAERRITETIGMIRTAGAAFEGADAAIEALQQELWRVRNPGKKPAGSSGGTSIKAAPASTIAPDRKAALYDKYGLGGAQ